MDYSVFDIESDGLLDQVTKIHCMSVNQVRNGVSKSFSFTDYGQIATYLSSEPVLVGHNIVRYDIPTLNKILGIKLNNRLIDTLALSWYLYPEREIHGLAEWGVHFGVPKPKVEDWENQPIEVYLNRCQEDVKINTKLFNMQIKYLKEIYANDSYGIDRLMNYLTFKMDCAREQEEVKWKLNVEKCVENLGVLVGMSDEKTEALIEAMPVVPLYSTMKPPKKPTKADGSLSTVGIKWFYNLGKLDLPVEHDEPIKIPTGETKPGNPRSHAQLKDWLFSLGWVPQTFNYVKEEKVPGVTTQRAIPQLGDDGKLCKSVKLLIEANPAIAILDGLFILNHRISILNGFLENVDDDGYLKAEIAGFTNTLRFKHKILVNLPTVNKPYGDMIRGVLIADEGQVLVGSDMSSLEDCTKQHYMFIHDPEYVEEMRGAKYDPHLAIAVEANMLTKAQADAHKAGTEDHSKVRKDAKQVNFASVYGAGPPKIALSSGMPLSQAKILHTAYWKKNWSVKKIASSTYIRTVGKQMWQYNPVSGFFYSLRFDKDRFSTLNQGTGVYCFDTYVRNVRIRGIRICGQFHDEVAFPIKVGTEDQTKVLLKEAIRAVNEELKLNVELGISVDTGLSYASIH